MTQIVLNVEDASLIPSLKKILGAIKGVTISKPQNRSYRVDPYEISPSGDSFFADARNVKAVEEDIARLISLEPNSHVLKAKKTLPNLSIRCRQRLTLYCFLNSVSYIMFVLFIPMT